MLVRVFSKKGMPYRKSKPEFTTISGKFTSVIFPSTKCFAMSTSLTWVAISPRSRGST